jgi:hypothetical protein
MFGSEDKFHMDIEETSIVRTFEPIQFGPDLWISIQAGYGLYSTPQQTFKDLDNYSHWEFAIFNGEGFISVKDILPDFPSLAELDLYFGGSVYAYVPTDLVEELYLVLRHY